ncbi:MAG TPA: DUF3465 domain-containing protein [Candidatus Limnocylindria bacterium]
MTWHHAGRALAAALALATVASCTIVAPQRPATTLSGNTAIQREFERHGDRAQLTATGVVDRVLGDQDGPSGPHERFIVRLPDVGLTVLIEHNLSLAPRVPVVIGEPIVVHGEYVWNPQGGLIHFTHHDPGRSHEGGYVLFGGKRYD